LIMDNWFTLLNRIILLELVVCFEHNNYVRIGLLF
jgi:hypothetical protein